MSDFPTDHTERLNLREQITRIDRAIAATQEFNTGAAKFCRGCVLAIILAAGALGGSVAAVLQLILRSWKV